MWKNYSADYLKNNRARGGSIMAASFIAALFLSLLCSLFYHFWLDNIKGVKLTDGGWHGRVTGKISEADLEEIRHFANVEEAAVNEELSHAGQTVIDIWFRDKGDTYQDMTRISKILGLAQDEVSYNYQLLSLYLIRIPGDPMPRLILPMYLAIVTVVCFSLILIIHNSFAVSQNHRLRQFGIFSSIGATPGQIRVCLIQEALALSLIPILLGMILGIALSFGTVTVMNAFTEDLAGGRQMPFSIHPVLAAGIFLLSLLTVLVSAWIPARKLSRVSPLSAIRGTGEPADCPKTAFRNLPTLKRQKNSRILAWLFGVEGELAGSALRAQKRALRTTSLSLTLAFLGFMLMQCFFTLSGISTEHTYFERYQDAWDIMVTLKGTEIGEFDRMEELRGLRGVMDCVLYQKTEAVCRLPKEVQSTELKALGGAEAFGEDLISVGDDILSIESPVVILDDISFAKYCRQIGAEPRLDGSILWNRFWDSKHSNFRYPQYVPFIEEEKMEFVVLQNSEMGKRADFKDADWEHQIEIPVTAFAQEGPLLREEYGESDYPLVQFVPLSLWQEIEGELGIGGGDSYIRILSQEKDSPELLDELETEAAQIIGTEYDLETENRVQEKLDNDRMIRGYELILGSFCVLLAVIGIAHVFSNTLGFLQQRKREFARLMSVGLTPEAMKKMFCIEALALVGCPVLVTLLLTIIATATMIRASALEPMEFIKAAPVVPILAFILAVLAFVALAYGIGGRKILRLSLAEALRDDTMV